MKPGPKPTLGYPTRTAAVLALTDQGLTTQQIADKIGDGVTQGAIAALLCQARGRPKSISIPLTRGELRKLRHHSRLRNISEVRLAQDLVRAILKDDLVTAVLDDEVQP